jgi:hypothetical protein
MWARSPHSYAQAMTFVRTAVTLAVATAVAAAGVLAATAAPAAARLLITDLRCDRGAGTYACEVRLRGNSNPTVPSSWATIQWYSDSGAHPSFDQHRFLTGSCVAGRTVEVAVLVVHQVSGRDVDANPEEEHRDVRYVAFRCLHIEPPGPVSPPAHGLRP